MSAQPQTISDAAVQTAYRRWAPFYDLTFGRIVSVGVRQTAARANRFSGRLLEVGVGTGLSLPHYGPQLKVTGIDVSRDMLVKARQRLAELDKPGVEALLEMDATAMTFPDASFDLAVAMYVITVVPQPAEVMREMARVVRPGGRVLITSHFASGGAIGLIERGLAPFSDRLGWRPRFPIDTILVSERLRLVSQQPAGPLGFFSLLEFVRQP